MRPFTRSFLLCIGLFLGTELISRVFFARTMEGRFDYGYHPTAGFAETSDGKVELRRTGGRRFFPQTFTQTPAPGTYRVMVIGDSVGRGKSPEASYSGYLQGILQAKGISAECLNLCVAGYGARRKDLVTQQALKYKPNLVILHIGASNEFEDEREWKRKEDFNSTHPSHWLMQSQVLRRIYEYKTERMYWEWLPADLRTPAGADDAASEGAAMENEAIKQRWDKVLREGTVQTLDRLKQAGVKTVIVSQVARKRPAPGKPFELVDLELSTWLPALVTQEVTLLPMKSIFTLEQSAKHFMDTSHVHPSGHEIIAQAIFEVLKTKNWLPSQANP